MGGTAFAPQQTAWEASSAAARQADASAPYPAGARLLRVWEAIGATMTISYGFELDGFLHGDTLRRAWAGMQRQFPYACTSIRECGGVPCFVHDPQA